MCKVSRTTNEACDPSCHEGDCRLERCQCGPVEITGVEYVRLLCIADLAQAVVYGSYDIEYDHQLKIRLAACLDQPASPTVVASKELSKKEADSLRAIHRFAREAVDGQITCDELLLGWRKFVPALPQNHHLRLPIAVAA